MLVNIYTYQTLRGNKRSGAGAYVLEGIWGASRNPETRQGTLIFENETENGAELETFLAALRRLSGTARLVVYTESGYLAAGLETYLSRWQESGWKTAKGQEIAHADKWQEIAAIFEKYRLTPEVFAMEKHSYRNWLIQEAERNAQKGA